MIADRHSEDYHPIKWVGGFPIYVTTLLVIFHVLTMVGTAVAMSITGAPTVGVCSLLQPLVYSSSSILQHFAFWQFVSYAFVNQPSVWFAIEMLLLYSFGREIEKSLGRRSFIWLYVTLLLVAPVIFTLLGLLHIPSSTLVGSGAIHFAIFIAFVIIYPNAEVFLSRIQVKWVAFVMLAIYSLSYLSYRDWTSLSVLWLECACAAIMLRYAGVASYGSWRIAWNKETPPKTLRRTRVRNEAKPELNLHDSIDPLLEKISKHGIGSLTKYERQRLEQARDTLLKQEKQSHH